MAASVSGAVPVAAADRIMANLLWWLCLIVAPAILIGLELFHPANFTADPGMYAYLSQSEHHESRFRALDYFGPHWWFVLHAVQTPMVCLVSIGLWQLLRPVGAADGIAAMVAAWLARLAVFVFLVCYTVLDAVGGIGLGRSIVVLQGLLADGKLAPAQLDGAVLLLNTMWTDRFLGGVGSVVSLGGSFAVLFAAILIALALLLARRLHWLPAILLVAFGWQLWIAHASPHGPIAFALLIAASGVMRWQQRR